MKNAKGAPQKHWREGGKTNFESDAADNFWKLWKRKRKKKGEGFLNIEINIWLQSMGYGSFPVIYYCAIGPLRWISK